MQRKNQSGNGGQNRPGHKCSIITLIVINKLLMTEKYAGNKLRAKRMSRAVKAAQRPRKKKYLTKRDIQIALLLKSKENN
jgi:hypothetical protein